MATKENEFLVCPIDGVTPACSDHPLNCPLEALSRCNYTTFISLGGSYIEDEPLPGDILLKINQKGSIKIQP